ncbi:MAG: glycosyltransferase family 39 protein [Thermomicrobiales bacterium]
MQSEQARARWFALLADWWLLAALVLALVMRLIAWRVAPHAELLGDEREYYSAAAILADGRGLAFVDEGLWVRSPLYIVVLGAIFRVFGTGMGPVWVVQTALGLATIGLGYLLARLCYERRGVARLAAGLCAAYLPFAAYAGLLLSETLFTFLLMVAFVGLVWHARRGGWVSLAIAGVALGAGALTRGSALPFLAAVPVWALTLTGWRDWRGAAWRTVLIVGVALAVVAPWSARNLLVYKALIPVETTGGYNFWLGAMGGATLGRSRRRCGRSRIRGSGSRWPGRAAGRSCATTRRATRRRRRRRRGTSGGSTSARSSDCCGATGSARCRRVGSR